MKCKWIEGHECHVWVGELLAEGDAWEFVERICPKCEKREEARGKTVGMIYDSW